MKPLIFLFATLAILAASAGVSDDRQSVESSGFEWRWDYPNSEGTEGSKGVDSHLSLNLRTDDQVEKVIIWYAKQTGLPPDHPLVQKAEIGFHNLSKAWAINSTYDHNSALTGHTSIVGDFSATHAHLTLVFQASQDSKKYVVISISNRTDGIGIQVLRTSPSGG